MANLHGFKGQSQLWQSVKPCGHDKDYYSFCPITFKLQIILDRRVKGQFQFGTLWIKPCGHRHNTTTIFTQSLSNFTSKSWMMRGETLLILGNGVKGYGQLWYFMYETLWAQCRQQIWSNLISNASHITKFPYGSSIFHTTEKKKKNNSIPY